MTNEEMRAELARVRAGGAVLADAINVLCKCIETLLERDDPDVEALIKKQRDE